MMKYVACVSLESPGSGMGLASRREEEIGGKTVLEWVLVRLERVEELSEILVLCRQAEARSIEALAARAGLAKTRPFPGEHGDRPDREGLRRLRKWAPWSWRGGLQDTFFFDEEGHVPSLLAVANRCGAEAVVFVPSSAIFLDPALAGFLIRYYEENREEILSVFTSAPPGLCPAIYSRRYLEELDRAGQALTTPLKLEYPAPRVDPATIEVFAPIPEELQCAPFRFTVDSRRELDLARWLVREGPPEGTALGLARRSGRECPPQGTALDLVRTLAAHPLAWRGTWPREVEVCVTDARSVPATLYSWPATGNRELSPDLFRRAVEELGSGYDDVKLTLGGPGEPLLHPDWRGLVEMAHRAGIWGIHLVTDGRGLTEEVARYLLDSPVDVITVTLNADSAGTYRKVMGSDDFDRVVGNIRRFLELRGQKTFPFLVPSLVKMKETEAELEAFSDRWYPQTGWISLAPFDTYAGRLPEASEIKLHPGRRFVCQKAMHQLFLRPDGSVALCREDPDGEVTLGRVGEGTLYELWNGPRMTSLVERQGRDDFGDPVLCRNCKEWFWL